MGQEQKEYTWQLVAKMLAGEASEQELSELGHLLRTNPDLHYPLQIITGLWRGSGPEEQKKAEEAFSRHLDRMAALQIGYGDEMATPETENAGHANKNKRRLLRIGAGCAAAVAAITACFWLYRPHSGESKIAASVATPQVSEVITREGSRTSVYLPDGTRVWLNAASKITYAKNFEESREVTLSGEAFFDVTRNSAKPFVIHTTRVDIKVLGTSFNVKSYPKEKTTEAVLVKGSIEVDIRNKTNKKVILKPNEKLIVDNDDSIALQPHKTLHQATNSIEVTILKPNYEPTTGTMIETSWVDNKLIFQDEIFVDLARQMERWYGVKIRFTKPELEQLQFTGSFEQETIRQALDALKLTAKFNYTIEGNQISIY
jgi:ferric-dicitrate binding protein FerR (iron transport regulator)